MSQSIQTAIALHQKGELSKAKLIYQSLLVDKDSIQVHYLLGLLLSQLKDYKKAIDHLERAAATQKHNPDWYNALAICYQKCNMPKTALKFIKIAHGLNPSHPNYVNRYCKILNDNQYYQESIDIMLNFLTTTNTFPEGYITLSISLKVSNKPFEACKALIKALRLFPNNSKIGFNLADAFVQVGRFKAAIPLLNQLIDNNLETTDALTLKAIIKREKREFNEAIKLAKQALEISPNNVSAQWNLGLSLLLTKNYGEGWKRYDTGFLVGQRQACKLPLPIWRGEPLQGKHILVAGEQGLGDQVMFTSHLNVLQELGAKVTLSCEPRLLELFKNSFKDIHVIESKSLNNCIALQHDFMIVVGSIYPVLSQLDVPMSPKKAYLFCQNTKPINSNKLKVGFSWKGGANLKDNRKRSVDLKHWLELLSYKDVELFCLQHKLSDREENILSRNAQINLLEGISSDNDIDQLIYTISQMDLVITVDNTVAHFAGALGIDTWCLIPFSPDWRWGHEGYANIWYKSVQLVRQKTAYNWHQALKEIKTKLTNKISNT